jgi:hypothetical protein
MEPKDDEIVVFRSFFRSELRFLMYEMIAEVLERFKIYLHQLSANVEGFCRIHELHYQTKARSPDNLHKDFGCYNFAYRKEIKLPVLGYRTKWSTGWTNEWFYMTADIKGMDKF